MNLQHVHFPPHPLPPEPSLRDLMLLLETLSAAKLDDPTFLIVKLFIPSKNCSTPS